VIFSTSYFPPTAWFASANQAVAIGGQGILMEQHEHFQKGTIRNRCSIAGPNSIQTLSIPLQKGKNQQQPITEVRVAYQEPWQRQHWRTICAAYGSAPYFPYFRDELEVIFAQKHTFLFDLNLETIQFLSKALKQIYQIEYTEAYQGNAHIFMHDVAPYPQVFEDRFGFRGGLSALDLLMCGGRIG
jgi:WbqC-like protein family